MYRVSLFRVHRYRRQLAARIRTPLELHEAPEILQNSDQLRNLGIPTIVLTETGVDRALILEGKLILLASAGLAAPRHGSGTTRSISRLSGISMDQNDGEDQR